MVRDADRAAERGRGAVPALSEGDAASEGERPLRTCVGCRRRDAQRRLVRVVADGAGRLKIDVLRREPGRGAYVHADRRCVEELLRKDAVARSLRRRVIVPAGVDAEGLHARIVDAMKDCKR